VPEGNDDDEDTFDVNSGRFTRGFCPSCELRSIQIQYQVTGQAVVTCGSASAGPVSCADTNIGVNDTGLGATSDSPGTALFADLTSADVGLTNNSTSAQTIQIQISANGFTAPVGANITLLSHVGGTVVVGGTGNSLSFQSCIDPSNTLRSVSSLGVACPAGATASGLSAPVITGVGSYNADKTATLASLAGPFAIDESFLITLSAGASINWSSSTSLTAVPVTGTPEPVTAALVGGGLIGLGLLRKRRQS